MTNYHTVVPGASMDNDETHLNQQGGKTNAGQRENRQQSYEQNVGETRIPGMDDQPNQKYTQPQQEQVLGKPIVGFLVSVSRTTEGEFWVLRQGQNTIGSGTNCNIALSESSVSGLHAVLAIHRNPGDSNRLNIGLMDRGSSIGTFVNGNYIGFNPCQCKNFDKINIGNYELLLMLFDTVDFDMKKSDIFISKDDFDYSDRDSYSTNDGTRM